VKRDLSRSWENARSALIVAHPGHELRVHHWVERARPLVLVLTDGSGHSKSPRIASTTGVLIKAGAIAGRLYGRFPDAKLYRGLLVGDAEMFRCLAEEIAEILDKEEIEFVVADAVEGVNPAHDLCRLLVNAALLRLERSHGRTPRNLEFLLEGPPNDCPPEDRAEAIFLQLDDDAFERKIAAVRSYPELAVDVDRILASNARETFRVECLRPVRYHLEIGDRFRQPAIYEQYGAKQVAAGYYQEVIRFHDHLAPLARQLAS
jgi:hypothetical protein